MPIDRRYIEAFLIAHADAIRGKVLEVGGAAYTTKFGGNRVSSVEILHARPGNARATIVADLANPATLPETLVDCVVCTQVLNFIYDFHGAIRGLHRLLKPGGTALVTLAGASQISRYDMERWGDYWRFTTLSAAKAFEHVFGRDVVVSSYGNVLAATALFQGYAVEDLPDPTLLDTNDADYQVIVAVVARKT